MRCIASCGFQVKLTELQKTGSTPEDVGASATAVEMSCWIWVHENHRPNAETPHDMEVMQGPDVRAASIVAFAQLSLSPSESAASCSQLSSSPSS